jgi:hypothetical protein
MEGDRQGDSADCISLPRRHPTLAPFRSIPAALHHRRIPAAPLPIRLIDPRRPSALQISAAQLFRLRRSSGTQATASIYSRPGRPRSLRPGNRRRHAGFVRSSSLLHAGEGAPATRTGATADHQTQDQLPSSSHQDRSRGAGHQERSGRPRDALV